MIVLKIILSVLGLSAFVLSFFLKNTNSDSEELILENEKQNYVNQTLKMLKEQVQNEVDEITDEAYEKTKVDFSKLSNNKINEFNEFAEELLEKISINHKEVIFLYDMLNEKDKEIKISIGQLEDVKYEINELINKLNIEKEKLNIDCSNATTIIKDVQKVTSKANVVIEGNEDVVGDQAAQLEKIVSKKEKNRNTVKKYNYDEKQKKYANYNTNNKKEHEYKTVKSKKNQNKKVKNNNDTIYNSEILDDNIGDVYNNRMLENYIDNVGSKIMLENNIDSTCNNEILESNLENEKIIRLYNEGASMVEISRKLKLGVGEVMLVINLYKETGEKVWN